MGGITALPNRNLISNIGFGSDATHTTDKRVVHHMDNGLGPLTHPSFILADKEADSYTYLHHIDDRKIVGGISRRALRSYLRSLKRFVAGLL
jgi:hypothetical protein